MKYADPQNINTVTWSIERYKLRVFKFNCYGELHGLQVIEMPHGAQTNHVLFDDAQQMIHIYALAHTNMDPAEFKPQKRAFMIYRTGEELAHDYLASKFILTLPVKYEGNGEEFVHLFEVKIDQATGLPPVEPDK